MTIIRENRYLENFETAIVARNGETEDDILEHPCYS